MNGAGDRLFNHLYFVVCAKIFVLIALRAFFLPINHDEASTFFFYVQSNNYLPYKAHVYTNNHVLNSALANICYHLAGSHRFVLRLPNLLSFLVLCFGVFRFFRFLHSRSSKVMLAVFFILTFNFLDFFEMCRGYGLSMAFLLCGLALLQDYFSDKKFRQLLLASLCLQLALAANLTLVIVLVLLAAALFVFQLRHRLLFRFNNLVLQALNAGLLAYWIKFSFFYRKKGVLDSGAGDDYWLVSFRSLMSFIYGTDYLWMQLLVIVLSATLLIWGLVTFFKKFGIDKLFDPRWFYLIQLSALVTVFYLLKQFMKVNYPEDRTGLFFYLFFALSLTFFADTLPALVTRLSAGLFAAASLAFFVWSYDLQSFTSYFYHVMPKKIYSRLEQEFLKDQQIFTVGGHRNREMNYTFANYRGGSMLNLMDSPGEMHMNCDYYYALKVEEPWYRHFYEEIEQDERWGRVLLRRKQKIQRRDIEGLSRGQQHYAGNAEFHEFLRFDSSALSSQNCIEAEIVMKFNKVPKPFNAFLVFSLDDANKSALQYKPAILYWIADDLNGQTRRLRLTSAAIPSGFKQGVVYLWNIDKKEIDITLEELRVRELNAPGINVSVPASYYPYISQFIPHPQL